MTQNTKVQHPLEIAIRKANDAGRPALIPFVTAGFPAPEKFWNVILELDAHGADIIEIGVPFSDPVADGPVVEEASLRALADGMTLAKIMQLLREHKGEIQAKIVLMGYLNPFLQYGLTAFATDAADAGVHGVIVPDLPFEENQAFHSALKAHDIALIPLVGPNTTAERMQLYADQSQGYVYVVSIMGTTGARSALAPQVESTLERTRSIFDIPLALGFGLQSPTQLEDIAPQVRPHAVVFGSALLQHIDAGNSPATFMQRWN
ncbi:MAG: tryptophan synthase subunit alpha [Pseudomonadota bacterium]